MDVKFLEKIGDAKKKYYQFTTVDDFTRLRVLKIYERNTQQNAIPFVDDVVSRLPFKPEVIQSGNGSEFGTRFHWNVLDQGINHVYIKPHRPRLNEKPNDLIGLMKRNFTVS